MVKVMYDAYISIHVPRVEDDAERRSSAGCVLNFNPRPPCGGRPSVTSQDRERNTHFNPRPPCGGRHAANNTRDIIDAIFQSTSPVWRTTLLGEIMLTGKDISIHVPRVEDDLQRFKLCQLSR